MGGAEWRIWSGRCGVGSVEWGVWSEECETGCAGGVLRLYSAGIHQSVHVHVALYSVRPACIIIL